MNGIYWDTLIPRLFDRSDIANPHFRIQVIADITNDFNGSIPCNIGNGTTDEPVYGVNKNTGCKAAPYHSDGVDVMAVSNLPNELPKDALRYFGEQLLKYILPDLAESISPVIEKATIAQQGRLTGRFNYLCDYVKE